MRGLLETAGERLSVDCAVPWVSELIEEGAAGELRDAGGTTGSILVAVELRRDAFDTRGWQLVTRGVWRSTSGDVVVENACTSGFDVHVHCTPTHVDFTFRWRPPSRERAAARLLRSRFHLITRSVLLQFPVLWWAGTWGRAPLHATACATRNGTCLIAAPGGVGRSTLAVAEIDAGATITGDNIAVANATTVWGLVEPMRIDDGPGRHMPHGRREAPLPDRAAGLKPDRVIVLGRGEPGVARLARCRPEQAARSLVTSTFMAGELRRFWDFAAILAEATGVGPPQPPVMRVADAFASRLPCFSLAIDPRTGTTLSDLLDPVEIAA